MRVIQLTATAGADGVLHLDIPVPVGGEYEVTVRPGPAFDWAALEARGWSRDFVENVLGSIDDDTFIRHPQPEADPIEPLDLETANCEQIDTLELDRLQ